MSKHRQFVAEKDVFCLEKINLSAFTHCQKSADHEHFLSPGDIPFENLPASWRRDEAMCILKSISRRIVHLTVLRERSVTCENGNLPDDCGSGFLTFHPLHGAIVHTSKHVVFDDRKASMTVVRLFYSKEDDLETRILMREYCERIRASGPMTSESSVSSYFQDDKHELYLSRGSCKYFRSVMSCDYTAFTCDMPVDKLFTGEEISQLQRSFSWWNLSVNKLLFSPQSEIDVAIISHPHGLQKRISFGKMNRLASIGPSLYDAPTCPGSSGSPIIRLHSDGQCLISAGQFIHHGYEGKILNMSMGMIRPPFVFPYLKSLDTERALANAIGILYEPICYWAMFIADVFHVESTFTNLLDVFAYTSTVSALFLTVDSIVFKILFTGFWLHITCGFTLDAMRSGIRYGLANAILHFISMAMFLAAWAVIFWAPWPLNNIFVVAAVFIAVLFLERYYMWSHCFVRSTFGSFIGLTRFRLQTELGLKWRKKRNKK